MRNFDKQPTLEGPRVLLCPLEPKHFEALFEVASDPKLWEQHPIADRYLLPVFDKMFSDTLVSGGALVVVDKASNKIVGSSRFNVLDAASSRAEIGWSYIVRSRWGDGTNAEVKALMLSHAFQFVNIVYFRVGETNLRSRRAMEKIGAVLTNTKEAMQISDGRTIVHVVYEISKSEFMSASHPLANVLRHE